MKYFFNRLQNISKRISIELINQITAVISLPLIVNGLDLEVYGFFTFCIFLSYLIGTISKWGMHIHIIEELSQKNINWETVNNFISIIFLLKLLGLIFYLLIIIFFSNVIFHLHAINLQSYFFLFLLAFLMIFNPLEIMQALGKIDQVIIPSLIGRLFFLFLLFYFRDQLSFILLIHLFIIMIIFPFLVGYFSLRQYLKLDFLLRSNSFSLIYDSLKKTRNTILIFLENHFFFICLSFILSFKYNLYEIAIFNFLIQLFRPGLALIDMSMRLTWQSFIIDKHQNNALFPLYIAILMIIVFITISIFGFNLFEFVIYNQDFLNLWPEIKKILYILCIEVIYFYICYIYLYQKFNFINKTEKIILPFLWLKIMLFPLCFFLDFSIVNIFNLYLSIKIIQIFLILIKVQLLTKSSNT